MMAFGESLSRQAELSKSLLSFQFDRSGRPRVRGLSEWNWSISPAIMPRAKQPEWPNNWLNPTSVMSTDIPRRTVVTRIKTSCDRPSNSISVRFRQIRRIVRSLNRFGSSIKWSPFSGNDGRRTGGFYAVVDGIGTSWSGAKTDRRELVEKPAIIF
jgi:hypothetical protein